MRKGKRVTDTGGCSLHNYPRDSKGSCSNTSAENQPPGIVLLYFPPSLPLSDQRLVTMFPKTTRLQSGWAYLQSYFSKGYSSRTDVETVSAHTASQGPGRELNILSWLWSLVLAGSSSTRDPHNFFFFYLVILQSGGWEVWEEKGKQWVHWSTLVSLTEGTKYHFKQCTHALRWRESSGWEGKR